MPDTPDNREAIARIKERMANRERAFSPRELREEAMVSVRLVDLDAIFFATPEARDGPIAKASDWLRACAIWLMENDLDMQMPAGVLDTDPQDIADDLDAATLATRGDRFAEGADLAEWLAQALRKCALGDDAVVDAEQPGDAELRGYFDLDVLAAAIRSLNAPEAGG